MDVSDRDESPMRDYDDEEDFEHNGSEKISRHRSKDRRKSAGGGGEDVEHRGGKERRDRRKEDREERNKDRDKYREKEKEKDRKEKRRERELERDREKNGRDREKEKERDRVKEKEREKGRDKHKERENEKDREREKLREKGRDREREMDLDKDRSREREKDRMKKVREEDLDKSKNDKLKSDYDVTGDKDIGKQMKVSFDKDEQNAENASSKSSVSVSDLENRISKMKEERVKKQSEGASEILSWVNKSRKLEQDKNAERKKALQLFKIFEEQDNNMQGESEDEEEGQHNISNLAGVKVLHGFEKVMDGGAVVLTLKDQSILADGSINEEMDMLENVEIGEQKRRDEAYKAAKKKTGIYDDKFNDDPNSEKKILPQYDDPAVDEGVTLDARGRFTAEAEKKLEELRRRLQGASTTKRFEDLSSTAKVSSDYYTQEEMLQFKKPKKKKALRKREKLNLDALEAEAVSSGLGANDLGSRKDGRRQAIKEAQARAEAELRQSAYQSAYAKADEAAKALRLEQTLPVSMEEDDNAIIADDEEDLYKSIERARKLALKSQEEASGPKAIALLATSIPSRQTTDDENHTNGETQENKIVFTEMEEFVWGLQVDEEAQKPDNEDVFMEEDEAPITNEEEPKDETGGWTEVKDTSADEKASTEDKEEITPDETIHEVAVGKGLSGALKLLKDRGTLKESIDWGGRNMDKKKSKLVGIVDDNAVDVDNRFKDIRIERTDEFGRIMTPKEAFRMISHKFHGKGPGKMKQEKRMKQYQEELKLKQMKNSDTPSESVERMREAQAQLKTPYLVLSGHVKPGQTSDPRSAFATVEKELPGGLTPMLGNSKVEHFLGIKRKSDSGNSSTPKKPKN